MIKFPVNCVIGPLHMIELLIFFFSFISLLYIQHWYKNELYFPIIPPTQNKKQQKQGYV